MRKISVMAVGILFLLCGLFGCGKKSGLEGKIVNGKKQPLSGVKVVAKQVEPIKGYEQFETTTSSDGSFKFAKLYPTSTYEIIAYPDSTTKNSSVKTVSAPEGETKILAAPVIVRFQFSKDGATALDTVTGLMWAGNINIVVNIRNWPQAMGSVSGLDIGGKKGWRLPTDKELEELAASGGEMPSDYFNSIGFKNVQAGWYWTSIPNTWNGFGARIVVIKGGKVHDGSEADGGYVWPVRTEQ